MWSNRIYFEKCIHRFHSYFSINSNISDAIVKMQERKLHGRNRISLSVGNISTSIKARGSRNGIFFNEIVHIERARVLARISLFWFRPAVRGVQSGLENNPAAGGPPDLLIVYRREYLCRRFGTDYVRFGHKIRRYSFAYVRSSPGDVAAMHLLTPSLSRSGRLSTTIN